MAMTFPFQAAVTSRTAVLRERVRAGVARANRTSRIARARAGYATGMLTASWGVGVLFGLGWSLLVGGVVASWSFLHLYPVDEP